jgi:hypothetical protein
VSRFCTWATVTLLLAVPALRLLNGVSERAANTSWAALSPTNAVYALSARLNDEPVFTAQEIQMKAVPLLARLASVPGEPLVIRGMNGRTDGTTQREWAVVYCPIPSPDAAAEGTASEPSSPSSPSSPAPAEVGYDADTGEMTCATTACDLDGQPYVPGSKREQPLTAREAVREARAWLRKLGLVAGQEEPSPVVSAPRKSASGMWRVWLQGRETPEGPKLTVLVTLSSKTEAMMRAVVVDRAAIPSLYLPRR